METNDTSEPQDGSSIHHEPNQLVRTYQGIPYPGKPRDKDTIKLLFQALSEKSTMEKFLWQYCPKEFSKYCFNEMLEKYLAGETDISLIDFIKNEFDILCKDVQTLGRMIETEILARQKKVGEEEPFVLPGNMDSFKDKNTPAGVSSNHEPAVPEPDVDHSDNKATQKIVFLHELGIIDFLRKKTPFNASTNQLAGVISELTGIPKTTVQSYINPIISKDVVNKNNPLKGKNLAIVKQKLSNMGYSSNGTK